MVKLKFPGKALFGSVFVLVIMSLLGSCTTARSRPSAIRAHSATTCDVVLNTPASPAALFPIDYNGKTGYMDANGVIRIEPTFDSAMPFALDGYAVVRIGGHQGVINQSGRILIENKYYIVPLGKARFAIKEDSEVNHLSFISLSAPFSPSVQCDGVLSGDSEGLIAVSSGGKWGFLDDSGLLAIPLLFDDVRPFSEGFAAARNGDKWGYIDHTGRWSIAPRFDRADQFSEGCASVQDEQGQYHILKSGSPAYIRRFRYAAKFSEGVSAVLVPTSPSYCGIDLTSNTIIPERFRSLRGFSEGLAAVAMEDGSFGYIDHTGFLKIKLPSNCKMYADFNNGLAMVVLDDVPTYVDRKGKLIIPRRQ